MATTRRPLPKTLRGVSDRLRELHNVEMELRNQLAEIFDERNLLLSKLWALAGILEPAPAGGVAR